VCKEISALFYSTTSKIESLSKRSYLQIFMESLSDTTWDVLIAGTGLSQSLLALYVYI
jgi:hypothetical protein